MLGLRVRSDYFEGNTPLFIEQLNGRIGWGLLLYGSLPASLLALGVIDFPKSIISLAAWRTIFLVVLVGLAPVSVTYLLVCQRLRAWYLLRYGLWVRGTIMVITLTVITSMIALAGGLLRGRYEFIPLSAWRALPWQAQWQPAAEAFLFGTVTLVGSSALFLTAVKDDAALPGLPSKQTVDDLKEIRRLIRSIQMSTIWSSPKSNPAEVSEPADDAENKLDALSSSLKRNGTQASLYAAVKADLQNLKTACSYVQETPVRWAEFFPEKSDLPLNPSDDAVRKSLQRVRVLDV